MAVTVVGFKGAGSRTGGGHGSGGQQRASGGRRADCATVTRQATKREAQRQEVALLAARAWRDLPVARLASRKVERVAFSCTAVAPQRTGDVGKPLEDQSFLTRVWPVILGLTCAALLYGLWKVPVVNGIASKSGFTQAFSLIFVSELGDKTFFVAALLAAQRSRFLVLLGSTVALATMTIISVLIGFLFQKLPSALNSTFPATEYLSAALLVVFGVTTLRDALVSDGEQRSKGEEELEGAKEVVASSFTRGKEGWWSTILTSFVLIFAAEWGDRSMVATVALVASQTPAGVAAGAIVGHFLATLLAITSGSMAAKYISERALAIAGGVLYIVFAAATLAGVF